MEILEILRILQDSQNQATAEQNREMIASIAQIVNYNAKANMVIFWILFMSITILAIGLVLVYLDNRKLKKQLAQLIKQRPES